LLGDNFTCVRTETVQPDTWCGAQAASSGIGGRLVTSPHVIQRLMSDLNQRTRYWIGYTDLLTEVRTSKLGWMSTEGHEMPAETQWTPNRPYWTSGRDDCLALNAETSAGPFRQSNSHCSNNYYYVCEQGRHSFAQASMFRHLTNVPIDSANEYCSRESNT
uniref:C-type lectin domain-containing protein n=1 Tax=Macrostomum lignano TaxID=282301 RepID=A0A1I8IEJ6_9PLAT